MSLPGPVTDLLGIIGHPLWHTMSPTLHNWAFRRLELPMVYMAWPVAPGSLTDFVTAARTLPITGTSVTIPHKETIIPLLDDVTERAARVGAVNTLFWKGDQLMGENTDVIGFLHPLREMGERVDSALVLGAGGAARAVMAGLVELGVERITLSSNVPAQTEALARAYGAKVLGWEERGAVKADLLVNATPLGMHGEFEPKSPWPKDDFGDFRMVYDLVYNPLTTRLVREAKQAGLKAVGGLPMFLAQAAAQFNLWTGREFPMEEGEAVVLEALGLG